MAKSTKPSNASGFDADKFLQDQDEKERQQERNSLIIECSIPWNIIDNDPPFPGMKLNPCLVRWEPENVDEFIREYGEEVKSLAADRKEEQETARKTYSANATKRRQARGTSDSKSSKSDSDQVTIMTEIGNSSEQNGEASEDVPMVKATSTGNPTQTESPLHQKETNLPVSDKHFVEVVKDLSAPTEVITTTDATIMTTPDKAEA